MRTLTFQIKRGGPHYQHGYVECLGEVGPERFLEKCFERNGRYYDEVGTDLDCTFKDIESGLWRLDFDGEYNTVYTKEIDNLNWKEKRALIEDQKRYLESLSRYVDWEYLSIGLGEDIPTLKDIYEKEGIQGLQNLIY